MSGLGALRKPAGKLDAGRTIQIGFRLLGWCAVTGLATAGLFVVIFAAFGNFTTEGFFMQLANLADRYGTADATRRVTFGEDLHVVLGCGALATMFCRRTSLARVFLDGGRDGE